MDTNKIDKTYKAAYDELNSLIRFGGNFEDLQSVTGIIPRDILDAIKTGYNTAIELNAIECTFEEYVGMVIMSGVVMGQAVKAMKEKE